MAGLANPARRLVLGLLLASIAATFGPILAQAQTTEGATVGLFLRETASRPCDISLPTCEDPNLKLDGETDIPYYAFLCVFNGDPVRGVAGLSCGIDYSSSAISIDSWSACSDLDFHSAAWPGPGTSNVITWDKDNNCQKTAPSAGQGVVALAGYFYLTAYGDGTVQVIEKREGEKPQIAVADCSGAQYTTRSGGFVGFSSDGSVSGGLPCRKTEQTTWSKIKESQGGSN